VVEFCKFGRDTGVCHQARFRSGLCRCCHRATSHYQRQPWSKEGPIVGLGRQLLGRSYSDEQLHGRSKKCRFARTGERYACATKGLRDWRAAGCEANSCATLRAGCESVCRSGFSPDHRALFRVNRFVPISATAARRAAIDDAETIATPAIRPLRLQVSQYSPMLQV